MSARRVAIDLGASSGRVAVGELRDSQLTYEVIHRFPNDPIETADGLKWDFAKLLSEIEFGLKLAGQQGEVSSVGVDSWAVDYGIVNSSGEIICSPFHYRSSRTTGVLESISDEQRTAIFARTGLQFLPFNTLYQVIAHQNSNPEFFVSGNRLLMIPDLIHSWLGGRLETERTNASTTQFYDPLEGDWADEIVDQVPGLKDILVPISDPGTTRGNLRSDLSDQPGLSGTQIIAPATHDTASAVLAVPMTDPKETVYVSSGTWSLVGVETNAAQLQNEVRKQGFSNEVGAFGTIRLLKNVMGLWILQECLRAWGNPDVESILREIDPNGDTPIFDPDLPQFLHPGLDMPNRVRTECPVITDNPVAITHAILASLAKKTSQVARDAAKLVTMNLKQISIVGGGSKNAILNQMMANVANVPVEAGPVEATLMGNLLMQFVAAGEIDRAVIRNIVRNSTTLQRFEPRK